MLQLVEEDLLAHTEHLLFIPRLAVGNVVGFSKLLLQEVIHCLNSLQVSEVDEVLVLVLSSAESFLHYILHVDAPQVATTKFAFSFLFVMGEVVDHTAVVLNLDSVEVSGFLPQVCPLEVLTPLLLHFFKCFDHFVVIALSFWFFGERGLVIEIVS